MAEEVLRLEVRASGQGVILRDEEYYFVLEQRARERSGGRLRGQEGDVHVPAREGGDGFVRVLERDGEAEAGSVRRSGTAAGAHAVPGASADVRDLRLRR